MSKAIENIKNKAKYLTEIRAKISAIEDEAKKQTEELKLARDATQIELIEELKKEGLGSIKTDSGDSYTLAKRKGVAVVNEVFALNWAIINRCVAIDRRLVAQKLKDATEIPKGFDYQESEYISIRRAKTDKGEEKDNE